MSALSQLLSTGNFIPVNKVLAKAIGLEESIILGELLTEFNYWEANDKLIDGMFYCTAEKLEDNTTLTEYRQRKAIKNLVEAGILKQEIKGMPATRYFVINEDVLIDIIFQTSSKEIKELVPKKLQPSNNINIKTKNNKISLSKDKDIGHFEFGKVVNKTLDNENAKAFVKLYEEKCFNLPKISKLTDARIKAINKLTWKYEVADILKVFELANESDFLTGKNDRGWKANMDFILREDKFINILEGKYGGKQISKKQTSTDIGRTSERAEKGEVVHEKF